MAATISFVMLINVHVSDSIRTWFSFVVLKPVFQHFGNCSTTDKQPTTPHMPASKSHIMPLPP